MDRKQLEDKVEGMFWGIAIGDALGRAVETFDKAKIASYLEEKGVEDGLVTEYFRPDGHKWFDGQEAGGITDDTELSLAVAEGLLDGLNMDAQAKVHVETYNRNPDAGYGDTTKNSIRAIANGGHWSKSATGGGVGNGVPMKIAPVAAHFRIAVDPSLLKDEWFKEHDRYAVFVKNLCGMTHKTDLSLSAAFAHYTAVYDCLSKNKPEDFNESNFIAAVANGAASGQYYIDDNWKIIDDKLSSRLDELKNYKEATDDELISELGGGSCYVYNSLPFTYAFFLRNPMSIESLYQVVSAGGDTDTNGSMLAALLGALHGKSIFPDHLYDGLIDRKRIEKAATQFFKTLAV